MRYPSTLLTERKLPVRVARIYKEKYRGTVCQTLELCDRMPLMLGSASLSKRVQKREVTDQ